MSRFRRIKKKGTKFHPEECFYVTEKGKIFLLVEMWKMEHPDSNLTTDQIEKELEKEGLITL